jgi:hypothetical protein
MTPHNDVRVSSTTVVTSLFDLARREPGGTRPTVAQYLEWGEVLLALDTDLVCFTEPPIDTEIRARRENHRLAGRTEIISRPLESLSTYRLLAAATEARRRHPLLNGSHDKDTPLYAILEWSKFEVLSTAMQVNPFSADHFIWADFGLAHVARTEHHLEDRVFTDTPDSVRLLQMRPLHTELVADRAHHLSYRRGHFAGGLISGRCDHLAQLCDAIERELLDALSEGFAPIDEQLLELAVARCPERFSFHHGDYADITENYRRLRGSADNLLFQLRSWREAEDWPHAAALAERIVSSLASGSLSGDPPTLAQLLEECFLASYYARQPDQTEAHTAASLYVEWAHQNPEFREEFLRHEIRVRTNFSFLTDQVEF